MAYSWKCPAGDFEARSSKARNEHIKMAARDPKHRELMKEKGKGVVKELKEKGEDLLDKIS